MFDNGDFLFRHDRDRFASALLAPSGKREDIFTLYAFNCELARIPDIVSQPVLGLIRLQWWQDSLDRIAAGGKGEHQLLVSLWDVICRHELPPDRFFRLIEARKKDFEEMAFLSFPDLAEYISDIYGNVSEMAMHILGGTDSVSQLAATNVGLGIGLVTQIQLFNRKESQRYLPFDMINDDDVVRTLADKAACYFNIARSLRRKIVRKNISPLLLAIQGQEYLERLRQSGFDIHSALMQTDRQRPLALIFAVLTGRF